MQRDFTYIGDITRVIPQIVAHRPTGHEIYNLGNSAPNKLLDLVGAIERATGKKAITDIKPKQSGDVSATFADISAAQAAFGFKPETTIEDGVGEFVRWFKTYQ